LNQNVYDDESPEHLPLPNQVGIPKPIIRCPMNQTVDDEESPEEVHPANQVHKPEPPRFRDESLDELLPPTQVPRAELPKQNVEEQQPQPRQTIRIVLKRIVDEAGPKADSCRPWRTELVVRSPRKPHVNDDEAAPRKSEQQRASDHDVIVGSSRKVGQRPPWRPVARFPRKPVVEDDDSSEEPVHPKATDMLQPPPNPSNIDDDLQQLKGAEGWTRRSRQPPPRPTVRHPPNQNVESSDNAVRLRTTIAWPQRTKQRPSRPPVHPVPRYRPTEDIHDNDSPDEMVPTETRYRKLEQRPPPARTGVRYLLKQTADEGEDEDVMRPKQLPAARYLSNETIDEDMPPMTLWRPAWRHQFRPSVDADNRPRPVARYPWQQVVAEDESSDEIIQPKRALSRVVARYTIRPSVDEDHDARRPRPTCSWARAVSPPYPVRHGVDDELAQDISVKRRRSPSRD
jgi:hypothetical protein